MSCSWTANFLLSYLATTWEFSGDLWNYDDQNELLILIVIDAKIAAKLPGGRKLWSILYSMHEQRSLSQNVDDVVKCMWNKQASYQGMCVKQASNSFEGMISEASNHHVKTYE